MSGSYNNKSQTPLLSKDLTRLGLEADRGEWLRLWIKIPTMRIKTDFSGST
jgi:hypothetical protein